MDGYVMIAVFFPLYTMGFDPRTIDPLKDESTMQ
jgi:hypothetical protein